MAERWEPVREGIHRLRFGDAVDVQRLETGDWRAEFLRDGEPILTCYPSKDLQFCRAIEVDNLPSTMSAEVVEAVMTLVVFAEDRGLKLTAAKVREWLLPVQNG